MRNPFSLLTTPVFLLYICILKTLKAMNQEIQQYQSDDARITLDVRMENDTVWLTQAQMAQLFSRDISVISRHIRNIFQVGELEQKRNLHFLQIANSDEFSTCKDFLQVTRNCFFEI